MDWSLLWQGVLSNLLSTLLIVGGGAMLTWLRLKQANYAEPARYGLIGAACIAVILFTLTGRGILSRPRLDITPDNIEANLKLWAEHLTITLERQDISDRYFSYIARLHGGDPVEVFRIKEKPAYFQFLVNLDFSPEHQAAFAKLSKAQQERVVQELTLEVARLRIGAVMGSLSNSPGQIVQTKFILQKAPPIENMSEAAFADSFDEMIRALALVRAAVSLALTQQQEDTAKQHPLKQ